ncbi:hypothetical protein SK128_023930 [Halocaridina rubra]|uniref:Uncharacterized protein n=1 Tax=Halocaridina rubra TaxID=373956 RepID=A0AAN8XJD5_HALRR
MVRVKPAVFLLKNNVEEDVDWAWLVVDEEVTAHEEEILDFYQAKDTEQPLSDTQTVGDTNINEIENAEEEDVEEELNTGEGESVSQESEKDKVSSRHIKDDGIVEEAHREPKLPDEGCFAPRGEPGVTVANVNPSEESHADELLLSDTTDRNNLPDVIMENVDQTENTKGDVCYNCDEIDKSEKSVDGMQKNTQEYYIDVTHDDAEDEEVSEEEINLLEEDIEEKAVFVEVSSELDEMDNLEVSANVLNEENPIITTPLVSENKPDNVDTPSLSESSTSSEDTSSVSGNAFNTYNPSVDESNTDCVDTLTVSESNTECVDTPLVNDSPDYINSPSLRESNTGSVDLPPVSSSNSDTVDTLVLSEINPSDINTPVVIEGNIEEIGTPIVSDSKPVNIEAPSMSDINPNIDSTSEEVDQVVQT